MSDNKNGPVFFHPPSETKDLSGFWGGARTRFCWPRLRESLWSERLVSSALLPVLDGWRDGWTKSRTDDFSWKERYALQRWLSRDDGRSAKVAPVKRLADVQTEVNGPLHPWLSGSDLKIDISSVTQPTTLSSGRRGETLTCSWQSC